MLISTKRPSLGSDRGATDPILVIASIAVTLVLLVGGSFAVAGIIGNGHNLNAKSDLDKVAVAETAFYAENDGFTAYSKASPTALESSTVGFSPTDGGNLVVLLVGSSPTFANGAWVAISKSATSKSGPYYLRTSERNAVVEVAASKAALVPDKPGKTGSKMTAEDLNNFGAGFSVAQLVAAAG